MLLEALAEVFWGDISRPFRTRCKTAVFPHSVIAGKHPAVAPNTPVPVVCRLVC